MIVPIEIWDLPVAGKLLQEWRHDASFATHLVAALEQLQCSRRFTHVFVTGGGVDDTVEHALAAAFALTSARDPFTAARAGAARHPDAMCVDVGQSSLKLARGERTWRVERDLARAPLRDATPLADREVARASTIAFLGEHLAGAPRIILGLPCELVDGVPRSCSYCFRDPDRELVPALAAIAGAPLEVVNDAELAALAARADPRVPHDATVLVLTIGFGVGGAVLVR
jgi:hypothetical protein